MKTITLSASQTAIAYRDVGAGPVVVLLHAFPLDSRMWEPQFADLASRYRLIAPDLPGFGGSAVSAGFTVEAAADLVAEMLDHLGVNERVTVGGLSMGGYIALAFARLHPQRLRALVLADTKADPDDEAARVGRDKTIRLATDKGVGAVLDQLVPKLLGADTTARRPDVVSVVRDLGDGQKTDGVVAALKALRDRPDARPGLAHVSVPTLILVGEQDEITPPAKARVMADAIPNARMETLATVGHLSNLENPPAFSAAVREFLDTLPTAAGVSGTV